MKKPANMARKVAVGLIGVPLLVVGLILIPLPGPGLLVSFLALLLLSSEFDWANKYVAMARKELDKIQNLAKTRIDKANEAADTKNHK